MHVAAIVVLTLFAGMGMAVGIGFWALLIF